MKIDPYLHAALLLHGAGKEVSKDNLVSVLKSAGVAVEEAKAQVLAEAVKGVNFEELLKAAAQPAAAAPAAAAPAAGTDAKKEEKKEDHAQQEQAAAEGLASLFG